jgi:hypothetical protein
MENAKGFKEYYQRYFSNQDHQIQYVLELFRKLDTSNTELAATVHYCLTELTALNKPVFLEELLEIFYKWSPAKSRFTVEQIQRSASWLKNIGLTEAEIKSIEE